MVALVPERKLQISEEAVISQRPSQQVDPRLPQDPGQATDHQQIVSELFSATIDPMDPEVREYLEKQLGKPDLICSFANQIERLKEADAIQAGQEGRNVSPVGQILGTLADIYKAVQNSEEPSQQGLQRLGLGATLAAGVIASVQKDFKELQQQDMVDSNMAEDFGVSVAKIRQMREMGLPLSRESLEAMKQQDKDTEADLLS